LKQKHSLGNIILSIIILSFGYLWVKNITTSSYNNYLQETSALVTNNAPIVENTYKTQAKKLQDSLKTFVNNVSFLKNVQVINKENKLIVDVYNKVTVVRDVPADLQSIIDNSPGKQLTKNTTYCENSGGMLDGNADIGEFIIMRATSLFNFLIPADEHCSPLKIQGIEYVQSNFGEKNITIRYVFNYYPIYKDLFLALLATLGLFLILTFLILLAFHFIVKPVKTLKKGAYAMASGDLRHKVKVRCKNEFGIIANFMNEVARNLEKIIQDLNEKERISSELDIAARIQQNLMPQDFPELPGIELAAKTRSSSEVGGDTFDIIQADEDNTIIYIGDVTGHGVPAGLIMIMVDVLIHTFITQYKTTKEIMMNVNRHLYPRIDSTLFMTMIMMHWNTSKQKLTYASAGHEHIIHYHAKSQKCTVTRSGGIALGMVPDIENIAIEKEIPLEENDAIVLYTDGITEARNEQGEMFGLKRLVQAVEQFGYKNANGIFDRVTRALSTFIIQAPQEDDITLIVLKYKGADPDEIEKASKKAKLSINVPGAVKKKKKVKWDWER